MANNYHHDAVTVKLNMPPSTPSSTKLWPVTAPSVEEMQVAFSHNARVERVFTEQVFDPKRMGFETEYYVQFETEEQAVFAVTLPQPLPHPLGRGFHGYTFSMPTQDTLTRTIYRAIGTCIEKLKEVDKRMVELGAVAAPSGYAVLSAVFMSKEKFDAQVERLQSQLDADPQDVEAKSSLHSLLVRHIGVDLDRRQTMLDVLLDRRIALLLELHGFDRDAYPFTVDLDFSSPARPL